MSSCSSDNGAAALPCHLEQERPAQSTKPDEQELVPTESSAPNRGRGRQRVRERRPPL